VNTFKNRRDSLADANAHRCQAVTAAALAHFMEQRRYQPGATAAKWMTERDSAAIDVQFVEIDTQFARASEPSVQNTSPCSASAEAMNWISDTSA